MFMLGAAMPEGPIRHHHTPTFDIDERVLTPGAPFWRRRPGAS